MYPNRKPVYILCFLIFLLNCAFWTQSRPMQAEWANVPPPPGEAGASLMTLGDPQLAYRMTGLMLQNFGDTGGRTTPLQDYNYEHLGLWFYRADQLDPISNHVPLLAAYYFGATQDPSMLGPVIDYLAHVGRRGADQKWRWLGQAIHLARFRMEDTDLALELAHELAGLDEPDMPGWARQMPVFILNAQGDRESAYDFMVGVLREEAENMHPNEVNFMAWYICEQLLTEDEAAVNPICLAGYN